MAIFLGGSNMNLNSNDNSLRFVPSRVEGLSSKNVTEAMIWPNRLELLSPGGWVVVRFEDIARWPWPRWFWKITWRLIRWPRWVPVADRDWFHVPKDRFFLFYTRPDPIIVYMPEDEVYDRSKSTFGLVQTVLRAGGFCTCDLG